MKKLATLQLLCFIILFFASCQNNTKELLIGKWIVVGASFIPTDSTSETDKAIIEEVNKEVAEQIKNQESFLAFKEDGTYEQNLFGDKGEGTWELKEDNKTLVNENGDIMLIEKISKEEFVLVRKNETDGFRIEFQATE